MPIYFTGLTGSPLLGLQKEGSISIVTQFTEIIYPELTNIEIGWNYLLLWQSKRLFISYDPDKPFNNETKVVPLEIPAVNEYCKFVLPHHREERISILSTKNVVWEYDIQKKGWKMINIFKFNYSEHAVKIIHCGYSMLLTNLGRLFIISDNREMEFKAKFIDIVHGVDHAILLAEDNNVYSIGTGMRGQLGNGDVAPCRVSSPELISELHGLKIVQISAGAWHSAAITEQGDLYTWGWNTSGELGLSNDTTNIQPIPKLVIFKDDKDTNIEVNVKKVRCGNCFTICLADDGTFWGTGTNKYSQLGKPECNLRSSKRFIKLDIGPLSGKTVKDFKCNEWGTAIITE